MYNNPTYLDNPTGDIFPDPLEPSNALKFAAVIAPDMTIGIALY